jgi:Nif-specific regulatory protein
VLGKLETSDDLPIAESNLAHTFVLTGFYTVARHLLRNKALNVTKSLSAHVTCSRLLALATMLLSIGSPEQSHRLVRIARQLAQRANYGQLFLELSVLLALSSVKLGASSEIRSALSEARDLFGGLAPFDVKLSASLALAEIESTLGSSVEGLDAMLRPALEKARAKKMRWHLAWGLRLWGEALLGASRAEEAEGVLREAAEVSRKSAERPGYWQAMHLLGRAYEQMLKSERALACYRVAALTINELAMDIEEERYKTSFLAQPRVREAMERYERLRAQVGKKARRDIAVLSLSERASRKMLGALSAIGQKLTSILDLDELMTSVLDLAIENVRAERGIIFLRDEVTSEVRPECARNMDKESIDEVSSFSRSVIDQAIQGRTLLTVDVGKDPTLSAYKSLVLHEIKSILCVPMKARGKVVGAIYLDTRRAAQMFTDRERTFVESFASQAAIAIENARLFGQMNAENARLRKEVEGRTRFENLIGTSTAMRKLTEVIAGVLESDCNVLILGESGTGKELVARAIHYNGPRRKKKFVAIDCGALPENLLEAELFGYARGAFTGADRDRIGLIEEAHGGTLFLDEITNTSMALQARLLRVIQEHEVRRVGENSPRHVDVRLVAASNADVRDLLAKGRFRQDLYYRLNVVTIEVPPLRQRKEDIPLLVDAFLGSRARNDQPAKRLGPGVLEVLARHDWPGNVRELENAVERMVVLASSGTITADDLPDGIRPATNPHSAGSNGNGDGQKSGEQIMIEEALRRHAGDKAKAARFIGWNRQKLYRRMKAFRIPADFGREG